MQYMNLTLNFEKNSKMAGVYNKLFYTYCCFQHQPRQRTYTEQETGCTSSLIQLE